MPADRPGDPACHERRRQIPRALGAYAALALLACGERPAASQASALGKQRAAPPLAMSAPAPVAPAPAPESANDPVSATSEGLTAAIQPEAPARYPFHEPLPEPRDVARAPATSSANLSPAQCRSELRRRKIPTEVPARPASGVATPVRLKGPLSGVRFVTPGRRSVYGTLDCRLVLALDAFSRILKEHGVVEVQIDNAYRPRARLPGRRHKKSQHAYGLAADVLALKLADGRSVLVERDWAGALSAPSCGPDVDLTAPAEETIVLRNVLCQAAREGVFHHLLTPNHDLAHQDHLHLDIQRGARSILLR